MTDAFWYPDTNKELKLYIANTIIIYDILYNINGSVFDNKINLFPL